MKLEQEDIELIVNEIVNKLNLNINTESSDQLMNKGELAKKLRCDPSTLDELYLNKPGFPKMLAREGGHLRFSHKAVDQWIRENQIILDR